ncbi:MAG: A24 family peptidase, partial [Proteobacteria bacterium]|nr:A24 family peptidase [Pseudomonadota bacterium]
NEMVENNRRIIRNKIEELVNKEKNFDKDIVDVVVIFISSLIVITVIDIDFQIIPDVLSISGIIISFFLSLFVFDRSIVLTLFAILTGGGIFFLIGKSYEIIAKKEGLGGGDVKLMAYLGGYLGLKSIFFIIFISSLVGTIYGLILMAFKGKKSSHAIPFGPFLSAGAILYLFFGERIIAWYLRKI